MNITLQLFGAFRPLGETLPLLLKASTQVSDIREALAKKITEIDTSFIQKGLIDSSRFASETEILNENHPLEDGAVIAIIPPVAGG